MIMELSWIQRYALVVLMRHKSARLKQLTPPDVAANLFTYHLDKLIVADVVKKLGRGTYCLTTKGQWLVGKFSTLTEKEEQNIKTVAMVVGKSAGKYLLFRWSRQPYLGQITPIYDRMPLGKSLATGLESALNDKLGVDVPVKFKASAIITIKHKEQIISHMNAHVYEVEIDDIPLPYVSRNGEAFVGDPSQVAMAGVSDFLLKLETTTEPFESEWLY